MNKNYKKAMLGFAPVALLAVLAVVGLVALANYSPNPVFAMGNGNQIMWCHFPQGNQDSYKLLTIGNSSGHNGHTGDYEIVDQAGLELCESLVNGTASLSLTKVVEGSNAQWSFDFSGVGGLSQLTSANNTFSTSSLALGIYSISEGTLPTDEWSYGGVECTGTATITEHDDTNSVDVVFDAPGETADCQFTNAYVAEPTPTGTITLQKTVVNEYGGNATQESFSVSLNGEPAQWGANEVAASTTYSISESSLTGYEQTGISCRDDDTQESVAYPVDLATEQNVTCSVTNSDIPGSITIEKVVEGSDAAVFFDFTGDLGDFELSDEQSHASTTVSAGSYTISELVDLDEWYYPQISCTDGSVGDDGEVTIELGLDEDVTCTFTNRPVPPPGMGMLTVSKVVTEGSDTLTMFDFLASWYEGGFSLSGGQSTSTTLLVDDGPFSVSEDTLDGWVLEGVSCVNQDEQEVNPASITLTDGGSVSCTFTNDELPQCSNGLDDDKDGLIDEQDPGCEDPEDTNESGLGSITIDKEVSGEGANEDLAFSFGLSYDENGLLLSANDSPEVYSDLASSTYTISEDDLGDGWTLADASCSDNVSYSFSTSTNSVSLELGEGDDAFCTFYNRYENTGDGAEERIIVRKEIVPGGDSKDVFGFTGSWGGESGTDFFLKDDQEYDSGDLDENTSYSVIENVIDGWDLLSFSCSSVIDGELTKKEIDANDIVLEDGEVVTCQFLNEEREGSTGNDNDSSRSGSHNRGGGSTGGEVLGASTSNAFCPFLRDYQHIGRQNDPNEVNKATAFFNSYLCTNLALDGVFDQGMFSTVAQFQNMFKSDILDTWVTAHPGVLDDDATGYLYQTTRWKINSIVCPGYEAFPGELIIDKNA